MYQEINSSYAFFGDENDSIFSPKNGPKVNPLDGFNKDLFDYYINTFNYSEAARYVKMYPHIDFKERHAQNLRAEQLLEQGERYKSIFSKIYKQEDKDIVTFSNAVFNKRSLAELGTSNPVYNSFRDIKTNLVTNGAKVDSNDRPIQYNGISKVEVTFQPNKNRLSFMGINLPWEFENDNSYENFLERSNYTEEDLKKGNVQIIPHNDGSHTLRFDFDSEISNALLYSIANNANDNDLLEGVGDQKVRIKSYDRDGNELSASKGGVFNSNNMENQIAFNNAPAHIDSATYLRKYKQFIDKQQSLSKSITKDINKESSSTTFGVASDRLYYLKKLYDKTPADDGNLRSKIKDEMEFEKSKVLSDLKQYPFSIKPVFSNINNKNNIGSLELIKDVNKLNDLQRWVLDFLKTGSVENVLENVSFGESNGVFGTFISIPANEETRVLENSLNHDYIRIFLPDFHATEAKERAYNDTEYRALRVLDNMETWNSDHVLDNGKKIHTRRVITNPTTNDYETLFYMLDDDGKEKYMSKSEIQPLIEKDYIVKNLYEELFWEFHNYEGNLINLDQLDAKLKKYSVIIANNFVKNRFDVGYEDVYMDDVDKYLQHELEMPEPMREKARTAQEIRKLVLQLLKNNY